MEELLKKAKEGDQAATEQIVSDYKGLIRSLSNKFYLVGGDKDDLLQEGMLGLVCAIDKYDESKGAFPSFAKMCVLGQILKAVKRDSGVKQKALCNYVDMTALADVAGESDPLEDLLEKEYHERVANVVKEKLSPLERKVLESFADGYRYEDIAEKLNRSVKSVDGALQRARKKLLDCILTKE